MVDITEIYVHWYAGRSKSALAASLGVDRKTVRKYLAPAEASGPVPTSSHTSPSAAIGCGIVFCPRPLAHQMRFPVSRS